VRYFLLLLRLIPFHRFTAGCSISICFSHINSSIRNGNLLFFLLILYTQFFSYTATSISCQPLAAIKSRVFVQLFSLNTVYPVLSPGKPHITETLSSLTFSALGRPLKASIANLSSCSETSLSINSRSSAYVIDFFTFTDCVETAPTGREPCKWARVLSQSSSSAGLDLYAIYRPRLSRKIFRLWPDL
jgi:hypothetical protein